MGLAILFIMILLTLSIILVRKKQYILIVVVVYLAFPIWCATIASVSTNDLSTVDVVSESRTNLSDNDLIIDDSKLYYITEDGGINSVPVACTRIIYDSTEPYMITYKYQHRGIKGLIFGGVNYSACVFHISPVANKIYEL